MPEMSDFCYLGKTRLGPFSGTCNEFLRITSGVTPTDFLNNSRSRKAHPHTTETRPCVLV